ncbi:MAG: PepSY domain-containing protein, partial [Clostridia bacterium]|nr:PepSY domain-containing protein [Clostridia bacterium]
DDDVKEPEKSESYIGVSKAKSIALSNAGIKAKDAKELKCTLDKEDGIYEVEFKYNGYEYEYDIDAVTGKILKTEKEKDDN